VGEHLSLGICVSLVGEHKSLGIRVSQMGEHISLAICVSQVGEHISLGIRVFQVGEHISLGMFPRGDMNTFLPTFIQERFQMVYNEKVHRINVDLRSKGVEI